MTDMLWHVWMSLIESTLEVVHDYAVSGKFHISIHNNRKGIEIICTFYVEDAVPQCSSDGGEGRLFRHIEEVLFCG